MQYSHINPQLLLLTIKTSNNYHFNYLLYENQKSFDSPLSPMFGDGVNSDSVGKF